MGESGREGHGIRDKQSIILEVENDIKLTGVKYKGRIICFPTDVKGKIGAKVGFCKTNIGLPIGELKHPLIF